MVAPAPGRPGPAHTLSTLPRAIVLKIFAQLPYSALSCLARVSKRYRRLITTAQELRPHLFLTPPPDKEPEGIDSLHPLLAHLHFFPFNPAAVVRVSNDNGLYISRIGSKNDFATYPAVRELGIRIISTGAWQWDDECCVENANGITVWDVVQQLTDFLNAESDPPMAFGKYFGEEVCKKRGLSRDVVMMNHEFLDPILTFPKVWFVNPSDRLQIIADYSFSAIAAKKLIFAPFVKKQSEPTQPEIPEDESTVDTTEDETAENGTARRKTRGPWSIEDGPREQENDYDPTVPPHQRRPKKKAQKIPGRDDSDDEWVSPILTVPEKYGVKIGANYQAEEADRKKREEERTQLEKYKDARRKGWVGWSSMNEEERKHTWITGVGRVKNRGQSSSVSGGIAPRP